MSPTLWKVGTAALLIALPVAGCGEGSGPDGTGDARLSVLLTDAPGDLKKAVVTISEIYLQGGGETGRIVLSDEVITTDLLTLANDTRTLVEDAVVPSGAYEQLRFVISGGYLEVETESGGTAGYASSPTYAGLPVGTEVAGELVMPSFAQTGIKVVLAEGTLTLNEEGKVLLVDFDAAQSFGRQAGQSGRWVMHPVITGTDVTEEEAS